jgi:hypothetical protein
MPDIDCPFRAADAALAALPDDAVVLVDMHGEATSEKVAMGRYLDGRVAAVLGTHTHVPTADARILPGGTAYVTDLGMTGPFDSVIGVEKSAAISRFVTGLPVKFKPAGKDTRLCAVIVELDDATGKGTSIRRIMERLPDPPG